MPGVLDPRYAGTPTSTGGGTGTVDPAQVEAIVTAEITEQKPLIIQEAKTDALMAAAADAQAKANAAQAAAIAEANTKTDEKIAAAKPGIVTEAVNAVTPALDSKVSNAVTAAKPGITTDVQNAVNATMDSKIQTQVQSQLGQTVIDEVALQIGDAQPSIEQNVVTNVNQNMVNNINAAMDVRQPTIVTQVKSALAPDIDAAVVAHQPEIVQQVSDATTQNINGIVDTQVVTHYPAIVAEMWAEVDDQVMTVLSDSFQAERSTIIDQVLNSIGDVDRAEVIVVTNRGVKADAKHRFSGGNIAAGSTTFNDTTMVFADSDIGKPFYLVGAAANGAVLATTIAARIDTRTVTLTDPAVIAVTSGEYLFGTDDTAAWVALMDSIYDNMVATLMIPYGLSLTDPFALKNNVRIMGMQKSIPGQAQVGNVSGLLLKPGVKAAALLRGTTNTVVNAQLERLLIDGADRFHPNTLTRYTGGSTTKGSNLFNAVNGTFATPDIGKKLVVYGAGANGGDYVGTIFAVNSPTQVVCDSATDPHPFAVTVANAAYSYGFYTAQGNDGVTTANSDVFNAASGNFTAADVGKAIELTAVIGSVWAGDNRGELLSTSIKAVNSPTQVVLDVPADLALTGVRWRVGMVHGVYQLPHTVEQQAAWDFDTVVFRYCSGSAVVTGQKQRSNKFHRTYAYRCRGMGMLLNSSNNELDLCSSIQSGGDGITVLRPGNQFLNFTASGNNGNGAYVAPAAEQTSFTASHMDRNDRNGLLALAKNVQKVGMRYTSNSQSANDVYSDVAHTRRYATGSVGVTAANVSEVGSQWFLSGNGYKPNWGLESAGPTGIVGTGVQYDPSTVPFVTGAVSQAGAFSVAQGSFSVDANSTITLQNGVVISCPGLVGTKIGATAAEKLGFFGGVPIVKPTATGKSRDAATRSLAAALGALGLIVNNIT